jgi:hypothetical protein
MSVLIYRLVVLVKTCRIWFLCIISMGALRPTYHASLKISLLEGQN